MGAVVGLAVVAHQLRGPVAVVAVVVMVVVAAAHRWRGRDGPSVAAVVEEEVRRCHGLRSVAGPRLEAEPSWAAVAVGACYARQPASL